MQADSLGIGQCQRKRIILCENQRLWKRETSNSWKKNTEVGIKNNCFTNFKYIEEKKSISAVSSYGL